MRFNLFPTVPFNPSKIPLKSKCMQFHCLTSETPGHLPFGFFLLSLIGLYLLFNSYMMSTILCTCAGPTFCFSRGTDILGSLVLHSLLDFNRLILINLTHPMKSSHCLLYKQSWRLQLKLSPLLYHYKTYKMSFPSQIHK